MHSPITSAVLRCIEADADATALTISRYLKCRSHTVHYTRRKYFDQGVLRRRTAVNTHQLGYMRHAIFLSLATHSAATRERLLKQLVAHELVSLVLELGGHFHLEINVTTRSFNELTEFLEWLSGTFGPSIFRKSVAVQLSHQIMGTKILSNRSIKRAPLFYGPRGETVAIDETDHRILRALMTQEDLSDRELARNAGVPPATFEKRRTKLEQSHVITGTTALIENLGIHHFVALLYTRGLTPETQGAIREFAEKHSNIFYVVENLGEWDFELGIETYSPHDVVPIVQTIHEQFEGRLTHVEVIPLFSRLKVADYPFATLPR